MSATATSLKRTTGRQRQTIGDLTRELGYTDVPEPRSSIHASAIIKRLIEDRDAAGGKPAPTSRQLRMIERLGTERGKAYKMPATRAQANAKISQILAAGAADEQEAAGAERRPPGPHRPPTTTCSTHRPDELKWTEHRRQQGLRAPDGCGR
jgi:hypothetical protein